jgi:hypothetical protein
MNLNKIVTRLEFLSTALFNDSQEKEVGKAGFFTVGERISINQERGYLYSARGEDELREYKVPYWIELKIIKSHGQNK